MKALIITVAGTATRFNKDTSRDTLKCLYFQENPRYSLLYQILDKARSLDKYIIVGGYLFEELSAFINCNLQEFKDKIELVYNSHYEDYGSGYSLIKGIEAVSSECDEVIFVEGASNRLFLQTTMLLQLTVNLLLPENPSFYM